MKEEIIKPLILLFIFMLLAMGYPFQLSATGSVNIKNNVRSKANTGGNTISGPGEIKTGDATAKSSVKTEVNSDGDTKIKVEAQAEANGEKVEVNTESSGEDVDIHKEAKDENANASVDIEVNNENENVSVAEENPDETKKGIIGSVKETFESFIDKIISLFTK